MSGPERDDLQATLRFASGSTATISYVTVGNSRFPKETLDVAAGGRSARLDNFREAAVWSGPQAQRHQGPRRPGQGPAAPARAVRGGGPVRRPHAHRAGLPGGHDQGHHRGGREPGQRYPGASVSDLSSSRLDWYVRRAARMSPAEVAWRARDQAVQLAWSRRQVQPGQPARGPARPAGARWFAAVLPAAGGRRRARARRRGGAQGRRPAAARRVGGAGRGPHRPGPARLVRRPRHRAAGPEPDRYAFRINHRSQEQTGNIKQVWEISRLHHLTLLATAWYLSRDEAYAERVAAQLRSWWQDNPFLSGVHWTSGIEIGIRLISFAWIRRLLDDWPPVDRAVRATASWRWRRSAGTSSTWPASAAAARRPTTT